MKSTTTPDRAVGSSDSSASDGIHALAIVRGLRAEIDRLKSDLGKCSNIYEITKDGFREMKAERDIMFDALVRISECESTGDFAKDIGCARAIARLALPNDRNEPRHE